MEKTEMHRESLPTEHLRKEVESLRQGQTEFMRLFAALLKSQGGKISIRNDYLMSDIKGEIIRIDDTANFRVDFMLKEE